MKQISRLESEFVPGGGRARAFALGILLACLPLVCLGAPKSDKEEASPPTVEEILSAAPKPEDYSESVTCLLRDTYQQVEVLDREHLLFKGRRGKHWLNRLRRACIGLRRSDTLAFDMRDNRLCNLDSFSSMGSFGRGLERTSARCSLGKFETISPEQAELLKESLAR